MQGTRRKPRRYRSPKRTEDAARTRQRILRAAVQTLTRQGECSLDKVASRAKVTRRTIYNHFDSRGGLIEAIFDELARTGGLYDLPKAFSQPDAVDALKGFVAIFCRFFSAHQSLLPRLMALAKADVELAARLSARAERRRAGLAVIVSRLGRQGDRGLIDLLFALTSMEFIGMLKRAGRTAAEIEALATDAAVALVRTRGRL
ncbi:MAG: TetR/AcrR family transcriptional regulator [Alphaproteobacteria bacterium]|nr:TetR/AcrR family transcriptional regulator [Alphaproteobacteria bacterium]